MKIKFTLWITCGWLFLMAPIYAVLPLPSPLINFYSPVGVALFKKNLNENSLKLLANFTTQETPTYCGIASAVMILNSIHTMPPPDILHPPYRYFTQVNLFSHSMMKIINPSIVQKHGLTLSELSQIFIIYGLKTRIIYANNIDLNQFREMVKTSLSKQQFVIVNFLRTALQEQGQGHHSPIAAYDEKTDRILLLDVARYKYPSYWVQTKDLWAAINTKDGKFSRGFIIVSQ